MKLFQLVTFIVKCLSVNAIHHSSYVKRLSLTDPDVADLVHGLNDPPPRQVSSLMECAAYASATNSTAAHEKRSSAFKFINGTCTLAQTPPFIDKLEAKEPLVNGEEGYHVNMDKPQSDVVHSDLLGYVLVNEQRYFNAHQNLPNPPKIDHYNEDTLKWQFDKESPVKSIEGHMAGTPVFPSTIWIKFHKTTTLSGITICVWYNRGNTQNSVAEILARLYEAGTVAILKLQVDSSGRIGFSYQMNSSGAQEGLTQSSPIALDAWYYIAFSSDFLTGDCKIHVNGTQVYHEIKKISGEVGLEEMRNLILGDTGPSGRDFKGYIASVEVYDKALSQDQVRDAQEKSTTYRVGY